MRTICFPRRHIQNASLERREISQEILLGSLFTGRYRYPYEWTGLYPVFIFIFRVRSAWSLIPANFTLSLWLLAGIRRSGKTHVTKDPYVFVLWASTSSQLVFISFWLWWYEGFAPLMLVPSFWSQAGHHQLVTWASTTFICVSLRTDALDIALVHSFWRR